MAMARHRGALRRALGRLLRSWSDQLLEAGRAPAPTPQPLQEPGGPPAHWLAKVRRGAPELLEPSHRSGPASPAPALAGGAEPASPLAGRADPALPGAGPELAATPPFASSFERIEVPALPAPPLAGAGAEHLAIEAGPPTGTARSGALVPPLAAPARQPLETPPVVTSGESLETRAARARSASEPRRPEAARLFPAPTLLRSSTEERPYARPGRPAGPAVDPVPGRPAPLLRQARLELAAPDRTAPLPAASTHRERLAPLAAGTPGAAWNAPAREEPARHAERAALAEERWPTLRLSGQAPAPAQAGREPSASRWPDLPARLAGGEVERQPELDEVLRELGRLRRLDREQGGR